MVSSDRLRVHRALRRVCVRACGRRAPCAATRPGQPSCGSTTVPPDTMTPATVTTTTAEHTPTAQAVDELPPAVRSALDPADDDRVIGSLAATSGAGGNTRCVSQMLRDRGLALLRGPHVGVFPVRLLPTGASGRGPPGAQEPGVK